MITQYTSSQPGYHPVFEIVDPEQWVYDTLLNIGILPHLSGYYQLRQAVVEFASDRYTQDIKSVYASVALEFKTTPQNVERNIRNAISCSYKSGGLELLNGILKVEVVKSKYHLLSNTQLISLLSHYYLQKKQNAERLFPTELAALRGYIRRDIE